jgi:WD40 repeat protein
MKTIFFLTGIVEFESVDYHCAYYGTLECIMNSESPVKKILVLSANPKGTKPLRLADEIREIKDGLERAKNRDSFQIESAEAVRDRDIHRSILKYEPQIVHFSGHGAGEEGLIFEDNTGQPKLVDAKALAGLFKYFADDDDIEIECVLLNACYSEIQAKAIAQHIDYVIGMSKQIGDKAAIEFAVGFYDALGAGKGVESAYKLGCHVMLMAGFQEHLTPQLLKKEDWHGASINITPVTTSPPQDPRTVSVVSPSPTPPTPLVSKHEEPENITKYRQKVEEFASDDGEIDGTESHILNNLQKKLGLTDQQAGEVREEVLEPYKIYKEQFIKKVEAQGYPLGEKAEAELKKLQNYYQIKDEYVNLLKQERKQQKEAQKLQRQREQQEAERLREQQEAEKVKRLDSNNNPEAKSHAQKGEELDWAALLGKASQKIGDSLRISKSPLSDFTANISQQIIHSLGNSEDAQEKIYQEKLQRYKQELWKIVKIEFPVSHPNRIHLKDFQVHLGLNDYDVEKIEQRITAQVQEQQQENTQQNLQNKKDGTWQCILTFTGHSERVNTVAINSIGTILVSGSDDKNIKIWDIKSGDLLRTIEGHTSRINAVSLSADNQILVSGSADQKVILWNPITGSKLKTLAGHSDWVNAVVISPNRHIIASSSNDKKIQIWHPETGKILRTIKDNSDFIRALSTDVNGQVVVSSGDDKTIKVWNLNTGKVFHSLTGHSSLVRTLALSQDGNIVVSGSDDQTIKIWNLNNGQLLNTLTGHSKSVRSVAISSDGNIVVSGSDDQTIKIWNLNNGELLHTLTGHSASVTSVAISSNGTLIASGSTDKTIRIWR